MSTHNVCFYREVEIIHLLNKTSDPLLIRIALIKRTSKINSVRKLKWNVMKTEDDINEDNRVAWLYRDS